jgi:[ribosomal protein S5]-alanine N-acetyltransferase
LSARAHPSASSPVRLYGQRVMLRPLAPTDHAAWSEVRRRNHAWLTVWEPARPVLSVDPATHRDAFANRCAARDRERMLGTACGLGLFVDGAFAGEINLNNITRGAMQSATIGYWIDEARAGRSYTSEGVVVLARYAFEELSLHRLEICIIPRNHNSRRVMEKLEIREEGIARGLVEINGVWEDHIRFGITVEEWLERRAALSDAWL